MYAKYVVQDLVCSKLEEIRISSCYYDNRLSTEICLSQDSVTALPRVPRTEDGKIDNKTI